MCRLTDCQKIVNTSAGESTMELLFGLALSTHLGLNNDYNEIHPHLRIENDFWIGGAYYNSDSAVSIYGGTRIEPNILGIEGYENFGLELGLTTGYDDLGKIIPFGRGTYTLNENSTLYLAPAAERNADESLNFGAVVGTEFRF